MTSWEREQLADAVYRSVGLPTNRAVVPLNLARKLLSEIVVVNRLASVAELRGARLLIRRDADARDRSWRVAQLLASMVLEDNGWDGNDTEQIDALAGCLRAPRQAFVLIARRTGPDFPSLATAFSISHVDASIRYDETMVAKAKGAPGLAKVVALRDATRRQRG